MNGADNVVPAEKAEDIVKTAMQTRSDLLALDHQLQEEIDEIEEPTAKLFKLYTKAEFLAQAFKREMLGYPVANARDILEDPHLQDRNFWQDVDESQLGIAVKFPGPFARFSEAAPSGFRPWFDVPGRRTAGVPVAFGHWSSLGLVDRKDLLCLDTGCVWGGRLTAVRIDDGEREIFHVECDAAAGSAKRSRAVAGH